MTESEWLACSDPLQLLDAIRGKPNDRRHRLCACACARSIRNQHLGDRLTDIRCWAALDAAERFADGKSTSQELADAYQTSRKTAIDWGNLHPGDPRRFSLITVMQTADPSAFCASTRVLITASYFISGGNATLASLVRDIFGSTFQSISFAPEWRTCTAVDIAGGMYNSRDFSAMPILAEALQEAGCECGDMLSHCRDGKLTHCRGCWAVDLVLGRE